MWFVVLRVVVKYVFCIIVCCLSLVIFWCFVIRVVLVVFYLFLDIVMYIMEIKIVFGEIVNGGGCVFKIIRIWCVFVVGFVRNIFMWIKYGFWVIEYIFWWRVFVGYIFLFCFGKELIVVVGVVVDLFYIGLCVLLIDVYYWMVVGLWEVGIVLVFVIVFF